MPEIGTSPVIGYHRTLTWMTQYASKTNPSAICSKIDPIVFLSYFKYRNLRLFSVRVLGGQGFIQPIS